MQVVSRYTLYGNGKVFYQTMALYDCMLRYSKSFHHCHNYQRIIIRVLILKVYHSNTVMQEHFLQY